MTSLSCYGLRRRGAFTLVELMVVISIIAVLSSLAFPVTRKALARGKTVKSVTNLRQIHQGILLWSAQFENDFPVNYWPSSPDAPADTDRVWYQAVGIAIYPEVYARQKARQVPWMWPDPTAAPNGMEGTVLRSPNAEPGYNKTVASYGLNTTFNRNNQPYKYPSRYDTARTALVGDTSGKTQELAPGTGDDRKNLNPRNGASRAYARDGVAAVVFLDGHVETIDAQRCREINADPKHEFWGVAR